MNPDPLVTNEARCITARQNAGVCNHRGEHSGVLDTVIGARAVITPERDTVRQQGRRIKEPDDNGIGDLLIEELERREEVGEIIATEDCIEMTNFMVNCPEGMSAKDCLLTLFSMMGCNLENVFIIHEDDGNEGEPIAELNQSILTEEGKKDWADVLKAKVTRAYESGHGLHVEVTGCSVKRLRAFANAVNGHCSDEEWSRWFKNDSENTEGFTLGEQA